MPSWYGIVWLLLGIGGVEGFSIAYSNSTDRSSPQGLQNASLSGNAYIFLDTSSSTDVIKTVEFTLSSTVQGAIESKLESYPPYDFRGGSENEANPWPSSSIALGDMGTMEVNVTFLNATKTTLIANFSTTETEYSGPELKLFVSSNSDRSDSQPLEEAILSGVVYIFLDPATPDVGTVEFTFQDAGIISTESIAPYDLLGGSVSNANPFDTSVTLTPGEPYEIVTEVKFVGEATTSFITEFSIAAAPTWEPTTPGEATPKPTQNLPILLVSSNSDRSDSQPLEEAILSGVVYIFLDPLTPGVGTVEFTFQDAEIMKTESYAPYDLLGGSVSNANPFDTSVTLTPGEPYEIVTEVKFVGGVTTSFITEFSIATAPTWEPTLPGEEKCAPISYLSCDQVRVTGNLTVDFNSDLSNTLQDKNGVGMGFRMVDVAPNAEVSSSYPLSAPGLDQSLLEVDTVTGVLRMLATNGGQFGPNTNNLKNALGAGLNVPGKIVTIETSIEAPKAFGGFSQVGLWFGKSPTDFGRGSSQDNYCRFVVLSPNMDELELVLSCEEEGFEFGKTIKQNLNTFSITESSLLILRMRIDPLLKSVTASYNVDGIEADFVLGSIPGLKDSFFSFDAATIDVKLRTRTFGGIFGTNRFSSIQQEYIFHEFSIREFSLPPAPPSPFIGDFERWSIGTGGFYGPTSMVVGPDQKLYVLFVFGQMKVYELNYEENTVSESDILTIQTTEGGNRLSLGIAIDPHSTPDNVTIWVAHSDGSINNGQENTGKVSMISNYPSLDVMEDVIVGLPRAKANHALNGLLFGPNKELYMTVGGNTGGGAALSFDEGEFGDVPEQPLSAAVLVADVFNPDFDGSDCATPRGEFAAMPMENCTVEIYSTGVRNAFDLAHHFNGLLYTADNGIGVEGQVPQSAFPPCTDAVPENLIASLWPGKRQDFLLQLEKGAYYGHPNPYRNECVYYDGSFQDVSPLPNYKPELLSLGDNLSSNGLMVYKSDKFFSQLMGDILFVNFSQGDDMRQVKLTPDGKGVVGNEAKELVQNFNDPLCIAQDERGTIFVGEFNSGKVTVLEPLPLPEEPEGTWSPRKPSITAVTNAATATLKDVLYVCGGITLSGPTLNSYRYNPFQDEWSEIAKLPFTISVENAAAVPYEDKIYVFSEGNAAFYDPESDSWTLVEPMPTARGGAMAEVLGNNIYVIGGIDSNGASLTTVEVFQPKNGSWFIPATPLQTPRANSGSAVLSEKIYIIGGRTREANGTEITLPTVEVFDPQSPAGGAWSNAAEMSMARQSMTVGQVSGRLQVVGGELPAVSTAGSSHEEYDPEKNIWRNLTDLIVARRGASGGTIRGKVYVACGDNGTSITDKVEVFGY